MTIPIWHDVIFWMTKRYVGEEEDEDQDGSEEEEEDEDGSDGTESEGEDEDGSEGTESEENQEDWSIYSKRIEVHVWLYVFDMSYHNDIWEHYNVHHIHISK